MSKQFNLTHGTVNVYEETNEILGALRRTLGQYELQTIIKLELNGKALLNCFYTLPQIKKFITFNETDKNKCGYAFLAHFPDTKKQFYWWTPSIINTSYRELLMEYYAIARDDDNVEPIINAFKPHQHIYELQGGHVRKKTVLKTEPTANNQGLAALVQLTNDTATNAYIIGIKTTNDPDRFTNSNNVDDMFFKDMNTATRYQMKPYLKRVKDHKKKINSLSKKINKIYQMTTAPTLQ